MKLQIRHLGASEDKRLQFAVVRDGQQAKEVLLSSPWDMMVGGMQFKEALHWYLERYLELPVEGFKNRADEVKKSTVSMGT